MRISNRMDSGVGMGSGVGTGSTVTEMGSGVGMDSIVGAGSEPAPTGMTRCINRFRNDRGRAAIRRNLEVLGYGE